MPEAESLRGLFPQSTPIQTGIGWSGVPEIDTVRELQETQHAVQNLVPLAPWTYPTYDPTGLTPIEFKKMDPATAAQLYQEVYNEFQRRLEEEWAKGTKQVLICGGRVVRTSDALADISNEEIDAIMERSNRACFVFASRDSIEDSPWTPTGLTMEDYYPTLPIRIGPAESEQNPDQPGDTTPEIAADFDTGNPVFKVFPLSSLPPGMRELDTPMRWAVHHVLGKYPFHSKKARIGIQPDSGPFVSKVYDLEVVRDRDQCPLLKQFPSRLGFVSRDIIRDLGLRVQLDPVRRVTRVFDS